MLIRSIRLFLLVIGSAEQIEFWVCWSRFLKAPHASLATLENGTLAPVQLRRLSPFSELAGWK
jgi:hypothetical protein